MTAIQTLLTEHINIWTAANTEKKSGRGRSSGNAGSVYGIKKLRELILELAVRGKLVPQDETDEPASALLKRIQAEKAKLIAEGKIKKDKPLAAITEDEKPFDLPNGWEWVRIGQIGHDWGQKTPDSDFTYIEVSAINSTQGVVSSPELVRPENAPSRARKVVKKGTVIYSTIRPYLLNVAVIEDDFLPEPIASTAFAIVHPFCFMPPRYFLCYFRSPVFVRYVESVQMGIAYPAINDGQFFSGLIPLPPLEEQHRIVAKVDELMALCDQMETQHNNAAEAHEKLVSHLLGTLTKSPLPPPLQRGGGEAGGDLDWQRIAAHFDILFTTDASIDALKQTLLQLAVMGKLVPQDLRDEPASALLKRIQAEKAKLIAEGKIKKDKPLLPITDDEKLFVLPMGWAFARWGQISNWITYGFTRPMPHVDKGVPIVTGKNVNYGRIIFENADYTTVEAYSDLNDKDRPSVGDILITKDGSIGRTAIVETNERFCINQSVAVIWLRSCELSRIFLKIVLECPQTQLTFLEKSEGVAIKHISVVDLGMMTLPLPPLTEQHRIVAKVDELMALCDQLKSRITDARQLQQKLADVLVEQAAS